MGNDQQNQSNVVGEMFDVANIAQPAPSQGIPGSLTPANIQQPAPRPDWPPAKNGFTTDNLEMPAPAPEPMQVDESDD